MSKERFIDLETRLAFLEDTVNSLNKVVYQQQQKIDRLNLRFDSVSKNLSQLQESVTNHADELPPHY
ncbi:MAG: SlyX family protein [Proteobacteria bacterium]|nr:SlyX family protein [Pseudomonadota bacterium]